MRDGGVNYGDQVLVCSQKTIAGSAWIIQMQRTPPHKVITLLNGFLGPQVKSVNGLLVQWEGSGPPIACTEGIKEIHPSLASHAMSIGLTPKAAILEPSPVTSHLQMVFDSLLSKEF